MQVWTYALKKNELKQKKNDEKRKKVLKKRHIYTHVIFVHDQSGAL